MLEIMKISLNNIMKELKETVFIVIFLWKNIFPNIFPENWMQRCLMHIRWISVKTHGEKRDMNIGVV